MYILFGDETDHNRNQKTTFFVYGALFVHVDSIQNIHDAIENIRRQFRFGAEDKLKFSTRSRPKHIDRKNHTELKQKVIEIAQRSGAVFCAQLTLHELAKNRKHDELVEWGANTILGAFDSFLQEKGDHGIAILDRMPVTDPYRYLREKFQVGLAFPNGSQKKLDRIVGLASTCDGASNISSVTDVVLGAFRYCVNEPTRDEAGRKMFPEVARLMWHKRTGSKIYLRERGILLRPKKIRKEEYQRQYDGLVKRLENYLRGDAIDDLR